MKKTLIYGLIIVVAAVLLDQISKLIMISVLDYETDIIQVIPGFFKFKLHYNPYIAFSIELPFLWQMIMTVLATAVFGVMAIASDFKNKKFYSWGVWLMIGGMIGNFIDRVFNHGKGVIDFLSFTFFGKDFATFNVADSFLVIGVFCVIIDLLFFDSKKDKIGIKK